jgi:hypothetical protein
MKKIKIIGSVIGGVLAVAIPLTITSCGYVLKDTSIEASSSTADVSLGGSNDFVFNCHYGQYVTVTKITISTVHDGKIDDQDAYGVSLNFNGTLTTNVSTINATISAENDPSIVGIHKGLVYQ